MSPQRVLLSALSSVGANKLRSLLTLLGIVIGVAAVIALMAIGRGAQESITSQFQQLGTDILSVESTGTGSLTLDDAYAMVDPAYAPSVVAVAPVVNAFADITFGRTSTGGQILGVTPEYADVQSIEVSSGEFISVVHVQNATDVVVLGYEVSRNLFRVRDPVGSTVKVQGRAYTVIGLLKQGTGYFGLGDWQVIIPLTTVSHRLAYTTAVQGGVSVDSVSVKVVDETLVDRARQEISLLLRLRHRITGEDDFRITNNQETIDALASATNAFVIFLGSIASISLLVGGIGIMNIMLVSVTERTREIGIRKAVGAKRRDILFQFMAEATMLSLGGGIIGVLLGAAIAQMMNVTVLAEEEFRTVVSPDVTILALGVSAAIGLFFGIYPAIRAAALHPIEALRYE